MSSRTKISQPELGPVMPRNEEAERQVLGAILMQSIEFEELFTTLEPDWFFDSRHQIIFRKLKEIHESGKRPDILNLSDTDYGVDIAYASSLMSGLYGEFNPNSAASIVVECRKLREVITACHVLTEMATEHSLRAEMISEQAIERFTEIGFELRNNADLGKTFYESGVEFAVSIGQPGNVRINTGLRELDNLTGGFQAGEVVIFTAETGVGKTLFAQQTRRKACADGFHTLYCSGEMLAKHLISRELASKAKVKHWKMRRTEKINEQELAAIVEVISHECRKCRILDGELSLTRIRRASRKMKQEALDLVVIDYDELVEVPGKDEWEQQKRLIREAKSMALELTCVVIVISQLRKALQGEDRKHPTVQRLYGSGAKAKHASTIIYVDREYVQELSGDETEARIAVLKNRDGRIGQMDVVFNIEQLCFTEKPATQEKLL